MYNERDLRKKEVNKKEKMGKKKDITGFVILIIVGLLIVQSKQELWLGVPLGITWGLIGLALIAIGLWVIFGNDIRKTFKR